MKKYVLFAFLFTLTACRPHTIFQEYYEFSGEQWDQDKVVEFAAVLPDSAAYQITLCLRYTGEYPASGLWCLLSVRSKSPEVLKDTLYLPMLSQQGEWLGQGSLLKTVEQPARRSPVVLPAGNVVFRLQQGMNIPLLSGVKNIGIKITPVNP